MTDPFIESLNNQFKALDNFIATIWKTFISMILTVIKYIKYFLQVSFKSIGYILSFFTFIFILIVLFSKNKEQNFYVWVYFFIGFTMISVIGGMIALIIVLIETIIKIYNDIVKLTDEHRTPEQKLWLGIWILVFILLCFGIVIAVFIGITGISFLHSIELYLFDKIDVIFKNMT